MKDVDFTSADLTGSVFDQCDFTNAIFDQSNLEKVDLRTSFNYSIDITKNKVKKSKHSKAVLWDCWIAWMWWWNRLIFLCLDKQFYSVHK